MKQDEYPTARLKRWSNRNLTVEPRWARPLKTHITSISFQKQTVNIHMKDTVIILYSRSFTLNL